MTTDKVLAFVEEQGVVLQSAKGPVPRLTEAIIDEPIKGSWWAHPKSHEIFAVLQVVSASEDILVCRLVDGKVTLVHRRLWPALVRLAERFPPGQLAKVQQEHTSSGRHENRETPFPKWVPKEVMEQAARFSEKQALATLGAWVILPNTARRRTTKRRKDPPCLI